MALALFASSCTNFHAVTPGKFYRSGQPRPGQLGAWIEQLEIKTVLRLRGGERGDLKFDASHAPAERAGIDFVQVPMRATAWPSKTQLLDLWWAIENATPPILVHCNGGADRSGFASALWVLQQTGDLNQARKQIDIRYWHTGWRGSWRLPRVLELYAPFASRFSFPEWVDLIYRQPEG